MCIGIPLVVFVMPRPVLMVLQWLLLVPLPGVRSAVVTGRAVVVAAAAVRFRPEKS